MGAEERQLQVCRMHAGSVQEHSEGQSNLARLFANGTPENRAAKESAQANGSSPQLLAEAQVSFRHLCQQSHSANDMQG